MFNYNRFVARFQVSVAGYLIILTVIMLKDQKMQLG